MATRYDEKTKKKVITFVSNYNAKNGRGGLTAASKKFSINPLSIKRWIDKSRETSGTENTMSSGSKRRNSNRKVATMAKPDSPLKTLQTMSKLHEEIESLKSEISTKEQQFEELKKTL